MGLKAGIAAGVMVLLVVGGSLSYLSYTRVEFHLVSVVPVGFALDDNSASLIQGITEASIQAAEGNDGTAIVGILETIVQGIDLNVTFSVQNEGLVPIYIPSETDELFANDVDVGPGVANLDYTLSPGQSASVSVIQTLTLASIEPILLSIITNEGNIDLRVAGHATDSVLRLDLSIPFQYSGTISIWPLIQQEIQSLRHP